MTDDELLELVQSKAAEDLTPQEIAALRERLAHSESLRTALFHTLQMEAYLTTALGAVQISPERIVARAEQMRNERIKTWAWVAISLGCALFLVLGVGALRSAMNVEPVVASHEPKSEEKPKPEEPPPPAEKTETPEPVISESTSPENMPPETPPAPAPTTQPPAETPPMPEPMPPAGPQPSDPWYAVATTPAEQLPTFAEVCFQDFPYRTVLPRQEDLKLWFEAVPGRNFRVSDTTTKKGKCGKLEGFARLRAPLPADGGLRFALEDCNRLAIHAYHGNQGVMLMNYEDHRQSWLAYAVTRPVGNAPPENVTILATDEERARRAEIRYGGPLELRYHDGRLLLVRGDIVLVEAPLAGPPDDIYFDGKATFEGLSLVRTQDFSLAQEKEAGGQKLRPTDLTWKEKVPEGAKLEKLDDGSLRLTASGHKEPAYLFAPLPGIGFREVIFELRDVSPGFGVFFGRDEDQVRDVVRVVRNTRSKRLNVTYRPLDDFHEGDLSFLKERPEMACNNHLWIKLLYGTGALRWWVSADGEHWAIGQPIPERAEGGITSLGLSICRTKNASGGTLASVTVRELPALNGLAPRELVEKTPVPSKKPSFETWLADVVESCPAGTDLAAWRRACAVRTLGYGVSRELAPKILESLLDDPATQELAAENQLALLREVMQVESDPRDNSAWKQGYLSRFQALGHRMAQEGGLVFSSVRRAMMQTPTWTPHPLPMSAEGQPEEELVQLLLRGESRQALEFCKMLQFYHFNENRPLLAWGEAMARREAGRVTGETARIKESWRHPLVEELNKEVYNFASDLHAIVESGAMDDASRMIASLEADRGGGLTPSGDDRQLFVSLPVAIKLALAQQPALRTALNDKLGSLAQLRVRQAIASGDEGVIELAATQFEGTPAAAEAYRWLGDRALQNGWFARALAEYRRAEASAPPSLMQELAPRARLAAAMMGLDHGSAATEPVAFEGVTMPAAEFETLVAEMKARGAVNVSRSLGTTDLKLPDPVQLQANNRARFDGPVGQNPHEDGARFISQMRIDYAGRQLATTVDGDVMYVSNRFQVAAYNSTSGQRLWQSQTPAGEMRRGQAFALIPMRPLATPTAVYARLLYGPSTTLCAFEKSGGKLLWQRPGTEQEAWASDPVFVQGQLLALSLWRDGNREMQLRLASLDPLTGDVLVQRKLVGLQESWQHYKTCEVTPLSDGLIASVAGFTLCCDAAGSVRWLRKHLLLPHEESVDWIRQYFTPPLVAEDRVVTLQPAVESLDCLDITTGKRRWSFTQERVQRLLGRSAELLFVQTDEGITALRLADGRVAWRKSEPRPRLTAALANQKYVLYMVQEGPADKPKVPALVWLDAANGQMLGEVEFPTWQDNDPRVGPLLVAKDRLWTFFSKEKDPNKDLVELTPGGPLVAKHIRTTNAWQRTLSAPLLDTLAEVAPNWQLVSGYPRPNAEKKAAWQGENDAALILSRPDMPLVLTTQAQLPAGKKSKVNLRIGHEGSQPGEFVVRIDGDPVFTQEWKAENANRWDSLSFDLTKFAGKPVVVSMSYHPTTGNDHALWLKSAQIVSE
jgi:outer membrane protein assembly factor BamB